MVSVVEAFPSGGGAAPAILGRAATADNQQGETIAFEQPTPLRAESFSQLDISVDTAAATYWCMMRPEQPCFQPSLLGELSEMQASLRRLFIGRAPTAAPVRYFVVGSHAPGIFNLGGDLTLFAALIRRGEREELRTYARACIAVVHNNAVAYELPIVTIAMVQGDALGGGFEAALSCNVIVAERSAKFGLPEILFNLFPGMGAYSFLSRRIGPVAAERMILSGKVYSAEELHEQGVIDLLVEDGGAPSAVRGYIARHARRHNAEHALYRVRQRVSPISYEELSDITDVWVDAAMRLTETELRKMERIALAQNRRWVARSLAMAI
jgi:DSF synthase